MMLEVPAAAVMIDHMLGSVDFDNRSNDLVQYLMAADRDNRR
ncbi:MAG: putative PEP-binding protein [Pirellulaceae bacterium]